MSIFNPKEDAAAAKPLIDAFVAEAKAAGSALIGEAVQGIRQALDGITVTVSAPRADPPAAGPKAPPESAASPSASSQPQS